MTKHTITVEMDEDIISSLTVLGSPTDVQKRLALSVADGVRRPAHGERGRTDVSLGRERKKSDDAIQYEHDAIEDASGEMVLVPRVRGGRALPATGKYFRKDFLSPERADTDKALSGERAQADGVL